MDIRQLVGRIAFVGGILLIIQSLIHSILGFQSITVSLAKLPQSAAKLHYWSWFAVGFMLFFLGLLAIYASFGLRQGKNWALIIGVATGIATFIVLITSIFIGIGYPLTGILGSLLLIMPLFWRNEFRES